jgi:hypothetical protein
MSFIKKFVEKSVISRREFLLKSALGIGGMAALPLISPLSKAMAAEGGISLWPGATAILITPTGTRLPPAGNLMRRAKLADGESD